MSYLKNRIKYCFSLGLSKTWGIFLLISMMLLAACERLEIPQNNGDTESENVPADNPSDVNTPTQQVTIVTRSNTNDIKYPVTVFVFENVNDNTNYSLNENNSTNGNLGGNCLARQTLTSATDKLSLSLPQGDYHLVAVSDTEGYDVGASVISMSSPGNYAASPLQMGMADISVGSVNQSVNIIMSYKVATLSIALSNIPETVTDVTITVSDPYNAIGFDGKLRDVRSSVVELKKNGASAHTATWTADEVCIFPGASDQTVFTISMVSQDGATSYGYTYNATLKAGTPYKISGAYAQDMISLSGDLSSEGWNETVGVDFSFGPGGSTTSELPTFSVSEYPKAGSIWDGHIVAYAYSTDAKGTLLSDDEAEKMDEVNMLLLSMTEWGDIASAASKSNPSQSAALAAAYEEGGMNDWCIPSSAEAKVLKQLYNENTIETLNATVTSAGGTAIVPLDGKGENRRYLCEGGTYTFAWKTGTSVSKAGATVSYGLRLVKRIRMKSKTSPLP